MAPCYRRCPYSKTMDGTVANFIVTFRLQSGEGYQRRYESLMEKLATLTPSSNTWEETSSFVAFTCDDSIEDVRQALYFESDFDPIIDTMVIIDLTHRRKMTAGIITYPDTLDRCLGF
ncbi:Uncharacterised protein [Pseudomonas putida]|nr:hypothetical protein CSW00_11275 [Pseudomonas sp. MR 02]CAB5622993.1 Uncharacterised protein [Pseudomonas putida]CAB5648532.1 Uncharacterised protein [Pseudomonas putida]CAB5693339.1 Uncharacterised protein [Pseudomonas putida]CAC9676167.1 Uncharacterised protein [Pseudomonas putida]